MSSTSADDCLRALSDSEKNYATLYLNENHDTTMSKIHEIQRCIRANDKLCARTDEFTILRFLRCCKFDIQKTVGRMHNYYHQRAQSPEWFSNRDPFALHLAELLGMGVFLPLREHDSNGRMIVLIRISIHNPRKHKQNDVIKAGLMILDIATRYNVSVSIHGVTAIFDMTGVTLGHALQMTPTIIQRLVHSWQGCYPVRIHSLNFVNVPLHVNVVLNIFKRFMTPKMRSKITIYSGSTKNFFQLYYPTSCNLLPIEYGGESGSLQELIDFWKTEAEINQDWYIEDEKYRVK